MTNNSDHSAEATVTRETLDETPARALKLLRGIGTNLAIRGAMASKGYDEADHKEGWALLHAASGFTVEAASATTVDTDVSGAIATIDAWDEDGFRIVRATLQRKFRDQAAVVLKGIGPSTGPKAVLGVKTLVERIKALGASADQTDRAAYIALAKRGIDDAELGRLEGLVKRAESAPKLAPTDPAPAAAADAAHVQHLVALRALYEEWSEIAHAVVKRRDHLILLGLAKRKAPKKKTTP